MFINSNDFLDYTGIDLNTELKGDSSAADRFLKRVESLFLNWCDANMGSKYCTWEEVSRHPNDAEAVRRALLEQALYMYRNGDLFSDSGYDPQRGAMIQKDDLRRRSISDTAVDIIKAAGLFSHVLRNRRRYSRIG